MNAFNSFHLLSAKYVTGNAFSHNSRRAAVCQQTQRTRPLAGSQAALTNVPAYLCQVRQRLSLALGGRRAHLVHRPRPPTRLVDSFFGLRLECAWRYGASSRMQKSGLCVRSFGAYGWLLMTYVEQILRLPIVVLHTPARNRNLRVDLSVPPNPEVGARKSNTSCQ